MACPAPPHRDQPELLKLAALKTLLLIRSVAHAEKRRTAGPAIDFISMQMRLATDSNLHRADQLELLLNLPDFNADFDTYLTALGTAAQLQINTLKEQPGGQGESTERKTLRRIQELAENRLGETPKLDRASFHVTVATTPTLPTTDATRQFELEVEWDPVISLDSEYAEDEQASKFEVTEYDRPVPPELQYRLGKGNLLQTQADRNLLPYAWNRLRPDEIHALRALLATLLSSADSALLGAFAHLALISRCSIQTACNIKLGSIPTGPAWTLDVSGARLLRRIVQPTQGSIEEGKEPPLRKPYPGWTRPVADIQILDISPELIAPLQKALAAKPDAFELGKLWPSEPQENPWTAFNQLCAKTPGLERVTNGLLGQTAEQIVFEETKSAVMARMLLVPAHATKPAAGWYASWTLGQANEAMTRIAPGGLVAAHTDDDDHNGLGSGIDPDDEKLREAFAVAKRRLLEAMSRNDQDGWVELHNLITTYSIAVLLACTAARPVSSVFERAADFDLELGRLFIDDKAVAPRKQGRWGRLVPLPGVARNLIERLYHPYLRALVESLRSTGQRNYLPLIDAIDDQLQARPSCALPYFFHVRLQRDGSLEIHEVDEGGLGKSDLFTWPLPWNLFRHRMATRLRSVGLDEELVAAQLGHAESGASTYGDYSTRCWEKDATAWCEKLEEAIAQLEIEPPGFAIGHLHVPFTSEAKPISLPGFGSERRQRARRETRLRVLREARAYLNLRLAEWADDAKLEHSANAKKKPVTPEDKSSAKTDTHTTPLAYADILQNIDPDQWTELGRRMLFSDKDTPRANGSIWYEAYEDLAELIHERHGVRMRSRFAVRHLLLERPAFHEDCIGITKRLDKLRTILDEVFNNAPPESKMPHALKEMLLAFDLCLNARVTDTRFLSQLTAKNRHRLRYHIRKNIAYIGFQPERTDVDILPLAWFILSERSFRVLIALKKSQESGRDSKIATSLLTPFLRQLGVHTSNGYGESAVKALAHLVECENSIVLPGIAAASRSARLPSWSLSEEELARIQFGRLVPQTADESAGTDLDKQAHDPNVEDDGAAEEVETAEAAMVKVPTDLEDGEEYDFSFPYIHDGCGSENGTRALLHDVRKAFAEFDDSLFGQKGNGRAHRASVAVKIDSALDLHGKDSSSAAQILVAWILELVCNKRPSGKWLKARSVLRYLAALSVGFGEYSSEIDLLNADEVEIEEFYDRVLRRPHAANRSSSRTPLSRRLQDERYVLARLMEFHRFAEEEYGIDSPDWSALGADLTGSMVSAHLLTPKEYHLALRSLCPYSDVFDREALVDAFVLLLTYRFGLRGSEAISLARSDWVTTSGACVVVVSARHRSTKSFAGRRQVPLLGKLSDHEQFIVDNWLKHWDIVKTNDANAPLFFSEIDPNSPAKIQPHRTRIVATLRAVCGNDVVTLHHARHSFANLLALRLIFPDLLDTYPAFAFEEHWPASDSCLQLLRHDKPTRRAAWALAATLGHAHPQTTFHHYTHFLHDWANDHCKQANKRAYEVGAALRNANRQFDLERRPANAQYLETPRPRSAPEWTQMTPRVALESLKLCGRGINPEVVAWQLRLSSEDAGRMREAISVLQTRRPTRMPKAQDPSILPSQYARLLRNRPQTSWSRIEKVVGARESLGNAVLYPCDQVADARQILVFCDEHLKQLKRFLELIDWKPADIEVFQPDGPALLMPDMAKDHGFLVRRGRTRADKKVATKRGEKPLEARGRKKRRSAPWSDDDGNQGMRRVVQVEMAKLRVIGQPGMLEQHDRLAIVPASREDDPHDNRSEKSVSRPEFVLIWLCMHLAT